MNHWGLLHQKKNKNFNGNYWAIVGPKLSEQPEDPDYRMTTILCLTQDITTSLLKFPRSNSFGKKSK